MNDHSVTIAIALSILGAIFTWILYRHRTKRRLKIEVHLNPHASEFFQEAREIRESRKNKYKNFTIWNVSLINPGYHPVHVEKVFLLYKSWLLGQKKRVVISHEYPMGITIKPGGKETVYANYIADRIETCPRKISGACAIDKMGRVWHTRKRLKVKEQ